MLKISFRLIFENIFERQKWGGGDKYSPVFKYSTRGKKYHFGKWGRGKNIIFWGKYIYVYLYYHSGIPSQLLKKIKTSSSKSFLKVQNF